MNKKIRLAFAAFVVAAAGVMIASGTAQAVVPHGYGVTVVPRG